MKALAEKVEFLLFLAVPLFITVITLISLLR